MQRVKFKLRNRYWLTYTNSPLFSERTHSLTVISQLSRILISDMIILCKLRRISILFTNSTFSVFARQCIFLRVYFLSLQGVYSIRQYFFSGGSVALVRSCSYDPGVSPLLYPGWYPVSNVSICQCHRWTSVAFESQTLWQDWWLWVSAYVGRRASKVPVYTA